MKHLTDKIKDINDKNDFLNFLDSLIVDLQHNPYEWENKNLESYLAAMARWINDMEGYYKYTNQPIPTNINWKVFADILTAAKMYE